MTARNDNKTYNQPLGGNEMPRFAGPNTMFRLPSQTTAAGLDIAIIGVPLDIGTSLRPGTRFGPRGIRAESVMTRPYGMYTKAAPFDSFQVADVGDVALNTFNLADSIVIIENHYHQLLQHNVKPVTLGGDHTIASPILRAIAAKHGPVAVVHVDAHTDTNDHMFGEPVAHGTIFRRAIELGCPLTYELKSQGQCGGGFDFLHR